MENNNKKRVIFLDVDGVLNSRNSMMKRFEAEEKAGSHSRADLSEFEWKNQQIDQDAVKTLNIITDLTGAELVISSTWRRMFDTNADMRGFFKQVGIKAPIVGKTPHRPDEVRRTLENVLSPAEEAVTFQGESLIDHVFRGHEIHAFITTWYALRKIEIDFVILDDDSDMVHLSDRLIQTDNAEGLTPFHINKVLLKFGLPTISLADYYDNF